jgi:hypothetical protein
MTLVIGLPMNCIGPERRAQAMIDIAFTAVLEFLF